MGLLRTLKKSWRMAVVACTPILLSPLIFTTGTQESKCAFMLCLCAIFFVTESLPLPVTALLPLALCPLLGLVSSKDVCKVFFGDISFLLVGGIFVAISIEESNLHKRVALKLLLLIGVQPKRLLLTLMGTTAFMSMWISNTASFSMMMPIMRAVLKTLFDARIAMASNGKGDSSGQRELIYGQNGPERVKEEEIVPMVTEVSVSSEKTEDVGKYPAVVLEEKVTLLSGKEENEVGDKRLDLDTAERTDEEEIGFRNTNEANELIIEGREKEEEDESHGGKEEKEEEKEEEMNFTHYDKESRRMVTMFGLGVCYAANVGGTGTLIGTPVNLVVARLIGEMSKEGMNPITFSTWTAYAMPVAIAIVFICYLWISVAAFGFSNTVCCRRLSRPEEDRLMRQTMERSYRKLGSIKFVEKVVLVHFLVLVLLWLTRRIGTNPGWAILFKEGHVTDGMSAVAVSISLFVFPARRPNVFFFRSKSDTSPSRPMPSVLSWKRACQQFPWGLLFLLGGGMVLAKTTKESGLSSIFADNLSFLTDLPPWVTTLFLTTLTCFATEITANVVVTLLLVPIVSEMAINAGVNPLNYVIPVGVGASYAFMLPVATPPNALLYAYGDVTIPQFMRTGFVMNILGILVASLALRSWGHVVYDLAGLPDWLKSSDDVMGNVTGNTTTSVLFTSSPELRHHVISNTTDSSNFYFNVSHSLGLI